MEVDVVFTPGEAAGRRLGGVAAVLIDVIRATTTITAAFGNGCRDVVPALTIEEAREVAGRYPAEQVILAGTRDGVKISGFQLGNSPLEYTRAVVEGKTIVLTSTNGTRALRALDTAAEVAICSFLNVSGVARWLAAKGGQVLVACAGLKDGFSLEDAVCAGMLIDRLKTSFKGDVALRDGGRAAEAIYRAFGADILAMLRGTDWGRRIEGMGLLEDLKFCSRVDVTLSVPRMIEGRISCP